MTDFLHLKGCLAIHNDPAKVTTHPVPGVCRGYQGKPIIIQPDGKKTLQYGRASNFGDLLDDKSNLIDWSCANALRGALIAPQVFWQFDQADDGWVEQSAKDEMKKLIHQLSVIGGSETKANKGTLIHGWSERLDLGEDLAEMPEEVSTDLTAYEYATEEFVHLAIEQFMVLDQLRLAGTPDRFSRVPYPDPDGVVADRVVDLKTGRVSYPHKMTVQLAIYAHAQPYFQLPDGTCERHDPWSYSGIEVDQNWGVILNLPAGSGQATLYWINIAAGWEAVEHEIPLVKAWRSRQDLLVPFS